MLSTVHSCRISVADRPTPYQFVRMMNIQNGHCHLTDEDEFLCIFERRYGEKFLTANGQSRPGAGATRHLNAETSVLHLEASRCKKRCNGGYVSLSAKTTVFGASAHTGIGGCILRCSPGKNRDVWIAYPMGEQGLKERQRRR